MNKNLAFRRKVFYLAGIVVLLLALIVLGQPASHGTGGQSEGGKLAQVRAEHGFAEAQLGEIDPASQTIKLATLGLRGMASNYLWEKANKYKMKKDWGNFGATLNQITKLEPHFVNVWRFQAWNLSYNCSVEFDDYRERYRWVIKGVDYLQDGIRINKMEVKLLTDTAWVLSQKIGRADEWQQFRQLFKADDDFHGDRPVNERDNWLVGKLWYDRAEDLVLHGGDLKKMSEVLFYCHGPMCQMNYCEAIEKDGVFGEKAAVEWRRAQQLWKDFGDRTLKGFDDSKIATLHLNDAERLKKEADELSAQLSQLAPGVRKKLRAERFASLAEPEMLAYLTVYKEFDKAKLAAELEQIPVDARRKALADRFAALDEKLEKLGEAGAEALRRPYGELPKEQWEILAKAAPKVEVTDEQVATLAPSASFNAAMKAASAAALKREEARQIEVYRGIVNFEYWRRHAEVEQCKEALDGRKCFYDAQDAFAKGQLKRAKQEYEKGFAEWRKVLDRWPVLAVDDISLGREMLDTIDLYKKVLEQDGSTFPENFILKDIQVNYKDLILK
jgi:hypothetical protein